MGKRIPDSRRIEKEIEMKDKVACITGSNGFIGKHLCNALIAKGYKVAPFPRELFMDTISMEKWLKEVNPTLIVHLASYGNHSTQRDIDEMMLANVVNTYTLLSASRDIPYSAFINVSSSSVYGRQATAMRETMLPEPNNMYGCTKVAGEYLARAFAMDLKKPVVNIRPFSVYGPGEADHRLIPTMLRSFILGEHMTLSDTPVHDWIYVDDLIDGILLVAEKAWNLRGSAINLGTGRQVDNRFIYEILKGLTGSEGHVKHIEDGRDYDLKLWKSESSSLRAFGWTPLVGLEQGLWRTYLHYKGLYAPTPLKSYIEETTEII